MMLPTLNVVAQEAHLEQTKKRSYRRNWENTFGKHTARCHPSSLVEVVRKEGKVILLLGSLGIIASILDYFVEAIVQGLLALKKTIVTLDIFQESEVLMFLAWSAFTVTIALLGMLWTQLVDPVAAGSGIPEMKTIISCDQGKEADRYLRARTLLAKSVGLSMAMGSGISVGKEGPFVHTASIIVHRLMKHISFFHRIYHNETLRRHMYNAACAVGVASTFRAPIGGVLFSIEVTSTFFLLRNYWKGFLAALSGSIMRQIVSLIRESEGATFHPLFPTFFETISFSYVELFAFALLGLLMGVLGAAYVTCSGIFRVWWKKWNKRHPFLWACILLVCIDFILFFPGEYSRLSFWSILSDLTSPHDLPDRWSKHHSIFMSLTIAGLFRLVTTICSTSLPLPAGDFIPVFAAGTAFGRLYGEVLLICFPNSRIIPGGYALVGGASLVAAATHTISVAVISMEFTGQFVYLTPLVLSVLIASGISSTFSVSMYDSVIITKGMMYLPMLRVTQMLDCKARDVMEIQFPVLTKLATKNEIKNVITQASGRSIPVVDNLENMTFFGCIPPHRVERLLSRLDQKISQHSNQFKCHATPKRGEEDRELYADESHDKQEGSFENDTEVTIKEYVDSTVLQVDTETAVEKVHLLFEMIKCSCIWVTRQGSLIGRINRRDLHRHVVELATESKSTFV